MREDKKAAARSKHDEIDSYSKPESPLGTKLSYTEAIETLIQQAESDDFGEIAAACDTESPIIDVKSIGSVADRASMFEKKLIKPQQPSPLPSYHHANNILLNSNLNLSRETVARLESIYGKKTEEVLGRVEKMDTGGK